MAVDNDSRCAGPRIGELSDCPRVIFGEENIRRLSQRDDIGEVQSQHRDKALGDARRIRVWIRDGNADLPLVRLVTLGFLPREYDELRNWFLSLRHPLPHYHHCGTTAKLPTITS